MEQKVLNLDLSSTKGTKIQVDGNPDKSFTLNLSDFGVYNRMQDGLKQLYDTFAELKTKMGDTAESEEPVDESGEDISKFLDVMKEMDLKMRNIMDYIFSAPVSEVCAPEVSGYMFDVIDGELRFEHIINALTKLYENNINKEYYALKSRIDKKLPAYVKNGNK